MSDSNIVPINSKNSEIESFNIDPSDPKYTFKDWDNFNGNDWIASKQDCKHFGTVTTITHKNIPTLKLFIAKEISEIFGYSKTQNLTDLIESENFKARTQREINEINDLAEAVNFEIPPRGLSLINYAGFHYAIMHSGKDPAKVVQKWIYSSVMPSLAETGSYNSDNRIAKLEDEISALKSYIHTQNQLIENISSNLQLLVDSTNTNFNNIINHNKLTSPGKLFTINEVVDLLNTSYRLGDTPPCTRESLLEFLRSIKMICKNQNRPYVKYEHNGYIEWNFNPFLNDDLQFVFSKMGVEFIINQLHKNHYI